MQYTDMAAKMAEGNGFIAALDQSGGSTPKALKGTPRLLKWMPRATHRYQNGCTGVPQDIKISPF